MLELEQAKKRAEELRALIEYNNRLYYDQDDPELEDFQYDALTRELRELEAAYPELVTPDSPTQHVGGTPSGRFANSGQREQPEGETKGKAMTFSYGKYFSAFIFSVSCLLSPDK